jgi:hypothetical protein
MLAVRPPLPSDPRVPPEMNKLIDLIRAQLRQRQSTDEDLLVVIIKGGLPTGELSTAYIGGDIVLERTDGELLGAFEARAVANAKTLGADFVVIGGLPR